jgi:transcriptional regulator with XRE-family HTH domain
MSDSAAIRNETGMAAQVDSETAEQFIAEKHIGERIKRLRLKKSMGLVELGRHTGLSASFLSQLETGRVVPTLRNLARVAMVFSKDLSYFFEPEPQALFRVHRRKERVRLPQTGVDDPTYFFESLGYMVPDRLMDPYCAEFMPLKKPQELRPHVHPGYEFLYVLQGELEIRHGDQISLMEAGDARLSLFRQVECSGANRDHASGADSATHDAVASAGYCFAGARNSGHPAATCQPACSWRRQIRLLLSFICLQSSSPLRASSLPW